jgi:hypothetical protein
MKSHGIWVGYEILEILLRISMDGKKFISGVCVRRDIGQDIRFFALKWANPIQIPPPMGFYILYGWGEKHGWDFISHGKKR